MPSTILAVEPELAARTFPRDQLAADEDMPAATSSIEAARQAGHRGARHCAGGQPQ